MKLQNDSYLCGRVTTREVLHHEIDELGHVNNAEYVKWIQAAAVEHWHAIANEVLTGKYMWFCSRHEIDYKQQLYENEDVVITTWLGEVAGARFDRFVDIRRKESEKPAVFAKTTWVLISKDSGRPVRIKAEILDIFC